MPNRNSWLSLLILCGLWGVATPALGQALVPHTPQINSAQLEKQGLSLAQEAAQLAQFQQYELALPRARLATQLAPQSYQTWFLLGGLYLQTDKYKVSIAALQQARSLEPKNSSILFALGEAHFQHENYNAAVQNLQAGLQLKPDDPQGRFDLGNAYYKLGRLPDAIEQYNKAITQGSWEKWPAINNIGLIKYEQGDVDGAIKQWEAALAIEKQAAEPLLAMAVALYNKGDRERALAMGEAALRIDGRYADPEYLQQNLWGDRLIADTKKFLVLPRMQAALQESQNQTTPMQVAPRP